MTSAESTETESSLASLELWHVINVLVETLPFVFCKLDTDLVNNKYPAQSSSGKILQIPLYTVT